MSVKEPIEYSAIILAAGLSSRFGSNKFLASINGKPLIHKSLQAFREIIDPRNLVVVLGKDSKKIIPHLRKIEVQFVINEEYDSGGMSSSIQVGLKYLKGDGFLGNYLFIHPGDVPIVTVDDLIKLQKYPNKYYNKILIPIFQGKRGHPLLLPKLYFKELSTLSDKTLGLKSFRSKYENQIQYIEVDNIGITLDVDTPEDLMLILSHFKFHP